MNGVTKEVLHISHNDLDGYSASILSELMVSCYPKDMYHLEELNILPNRLISNVTSVIERLDDYDMIIITDLAMNQTVIDLIENCKDPEKFRVFDHHEVELDHIPDWAVISKTSPTNPERLTCATELYYTFLKEDRAFSQVVYELHGSLHALNHFVETVRVYDTFEFWKTRDDENTKYDIVMSDAPRLNTLFHVLEREQFKEYIMNYFKGDGIDWMQLTTDNGKYPWLNVILQLEIDKNARYIQAALKKVLALPFHYKIYRNGKIHSLNYTCGMVFAEKNGPIIGNTTCEINPDLDFCAVVSNNQVSLYTRKEEVNVRDIAVLFGGGGHVDAAGFTIPYQNANVFNTNHFYDIIQCAGRFGWKSPNSLWIEEAVSSSDV